MPVANIRRNDRTVYEDLLIRQGTTFSLTVTLKDDAGNAFDLTTYSVRGQLRKTVISSTSTAFTGAVTDATGGVLTISLTSVETAALDAPKNYFYDVEIYTADATPVVHRVLQGMAEVNPEITR